MDTIKEIESAVTQLEPDAFIQFRTWFEDYDAQLWDEQFEQDVVSGKLDVMAKKAIESFKAGHCKKL